MTRLALVAGALLGALSVFAACAPPGDSASPDAFEGSSAAHTATPAATPTPIVTPTAAGAATPTPPNTPAPKTPSPQQSLPAGFTHVTDLAPGIRVELRYATSRNFTGAPVPGYESKTAAILRTSAAKALAKVQSDLKKKGLGLLVYDAYRPVRAVAAFVKWSQNSDQSTKARYYPNVDKKRLFSLGYIARRSSHSLGSTVDLTIVGENGRPLDMGGEFDLFDRRSHYRTDGLTAAQTRNRATLRDAMLARGFTPYSSEWWHFTYSPAMTGERQNFPVR